MKQFKQEWKDIGKALLAMLALGLVMEVMDWSPCGAVYNREVWECTE